MDRHQPVPYLASVRSSIALAPLATAALLGLVDTARAAGPSEPPVTEAASALPALGNTAEGDRTLLREIGDEHVHGEASHGEPLVVERAAADATAREPDDVWERVRRSTRLEVPDNEAVRTERRRLRDEALWIDKILRRATPYAAHLVAALDDRYLPLELALLPVIESGFRPHARSPDRATGLWQLMPETAREIGVRRDRWFDGRRDIVVSTTAALDYLSYLNALYHGDWELTLAAYNAGPGRVRAAQRRARAAGGSLDFWSLALPRETRVYVPRFLALVALVREGEEGPLELPSVPIEPAFVKVDVGRRVSVERAAALGSLSPESLRRLNAGLVHGVTPPGGPHELYLPRGSRARLVERLAATDADASFGPPSVHEVVAGDTLGALARAYGISERRLMTLNGLEDARILVGQRLALLDSDALAEDSVEHLVVPGDTLSSIARRYSVGVEAISRADGSALDTDLIRVGDTLRVRLSPDTG